MSDSFRKTFVISRPLDTRLKKVSKVTGIPESELIRRGLDAYLDKYTKKIGSK